jgi:hypothetical protein
MLDASAHSHQEHASDLYWQYFFLECLVGLDNEAYRPPIPRYWLWEEEFDITFEWEQSVKNRLRTLVVETGVAETLPDVSRPFVLNRLHEYVRAEYPVFHLTWAEPSTSAKTRNTLWQHWTGDVSWNLLRNHLREGHDEETWDQEVSTVSCCSGST